MFILIHSHIRELKRKRTRDGMVGRMRNTNIIFFKIFHPIHYTIKMFLSQRTNGKKERWISG